MLGIGLALAASFSWGIGDFIGGMKSRVLPVLVVLAVSQVVGLTWIASVAIVAGEPVPGQREVVLAAISALAGLAGLACFFRAIAIGKMSVVAPVAAMAAAVPVVVGIASGDRPSSVQVVGMAVALAGAVLASREPVGDGDRAARIAAGVLLAAASAVLFGLFFLGIDAAAEGGIVWATLVNRITSVSILIAVVLAVRPDLAAARPHAPALAAAGTLDVGANLLLAAAATQGLISLVSVAASLYPAVTVVLARVILHEQMQRIQEVGAAFALGGVVLIAAG